MTKIADFQIKVCMKLQKSLRLKKILGLRTNSEFFLQHIRGTTEKTQWPNTKIQIIHARANFV